MRILHIAPFYEPAWAYGGMTRAATGLCRALASRGHDVSVATALLEPSWPREQELDGVHVHRFPGPALLRRLLVPWGIGLRGFLRREIDTVDVVHIHGHRSGLALTTGRALARTRVPWVLAPNGTFPHHEQRRVFKALFDGLGGKAIVDGASALIATSRAEARDLPRSAHVVPNGIEAPGRPSPSSKEAHLLLFVGNGRPQKRGHWLPILLERLPQVRLSLVGPFGKSFLALFRSVAARVDVRGVLAGEALANAYSSAGLVVHPAKNEAFGLVPFEAALLGTPAVVAGGHGLGEWFGSAGGCVVPPDDLDAFAEAVARRLASPHLGVGEAARVAEFAKRELTWARAAELTETVYLSLVREKKPRGGMDGPEG